MTARAPVVEGASVEAGAKEPAPGDDLERWASRLSAQGALRHDGPSFHVGSEE